MTPDSLHRPWRGERFYLRPPAHRSARDGGEFPAPAFAVRVRDLDALDERRERMRAAFVRAMDASGLCAAAVARALDRSVYSVLRWRKRGPHAIPLDAFMAAAALFGSPAMVDELLPEGLRCVAEGGGEPEVRAEVRRCLGGRP